MRFWLVPLLFLTGCFNKEFNEPGKISINRRPTETSVGTSFERTWAATQQILSRFPIEKKDAQASSGRAYLVTDWIFGKSDVLYSGYDVSRVPFPVRYKLYVYVIGGGGATAVKINNVEQYKDDVVTAGVDFQGSVHTWIRTESSTLKEARILEEITKLAMDQNFEVAPQLP